MTVGLLEPIDVDEVVAVLCDAFHDYPVMRFVLGAADPAYAARLPVLLGLFVRARAMRDDPVFGARDEGGRLLGVATTTAPGDRRAARGFPIVREAVWAELGAEARARYETFAAAGEAYAPPGPHCWVNMLGVRRAHAGQGIGRRLLDAVHARSRADVSSTGVALSTEDAGNVPLYEHLGYRVLGRAPVAPGLETWVFWRPDDP